MCLGQYSARTHQGFPALHLVMTRDHVTNHEATMGKCRLHVEHINLQSLVRGGALDDV